MRTIIILGLLTLLSLFLISCTTELSEGEMIAIMEDLNTAIRARDIDAILALHTDDVELISRPPYGKLKGKEQTREFFETELDNLDILSWDDCSLTGGTFICKVRVRFKGELPYDFQERIKFKDGKIDYAIPVIGSD